MLSWFRKKPAADAAGASDTVEASIVTAAVITAPVATVEVPPAAIGEAMETVVAEADGGGWLQRLSSGLSRSTGRLTGGIADLVTKRKLDDAMLEQLEEALIGADIGPRLATKLAAEFGRQRFGQDITEAEVKAFLADSLATKLNAAAQPFAIDETRQPFVILMVGVNGSGKTTTLGKLAAQLQGEDKKVRMVAGDTFRAAATEQLQGWGARTGIEVVAGQTNADAAGLAFEAYQAARRDAVDVLLIDTAGRLQNKSDLMAELQKLVRAIQKVDATAPHATLLVLDATTGQNALSQVATFKDVAPLTGLVVTKLDGTAKGGIVVALADQFSLPIVAVGVGEGVADLQPFQPAAFARALVGL